MHPTSASSRRIWSFGVLLSIFLMAGPWAYAQNPAAGTGAEGTKQRVSKRASRSAVTATNEVLVFLEPGTDPLSYARDHGLQFRYRLVSDPNACVFATATVTRAATVKTQLKNDRRSRRVFDNPIVRPVRRTFVPNDPYFNAHTPTTGFPGQWHLFNSFFAGRDVNVQNAWNRDVTGTGVTIGIVDDGLEHTHPDLSPNFSSMKSRDFGQSDADPLPVYADDNHGTSVAGVAAARGGNGIGVTGAAPLASLAGLRCDFANGTMAQFVDATMYRSSGATVDIQVKNHSYGYDVNYIDTASEVFAFEQSAASGTLHTVAAGNERGAVSEDANKQAAATTPATIAVAALGSNGVFSSYSNFGACVFVTAPSNTQGGYGITTTDRAGTAGYNGSGGYGDTYPDTNYTSVFGGTSSAAPLVAGVLALGKQVRPDMDVRLAKHLLVLTSDEVDPTDATVESDGGWKTNGAGRRFNQNYGFGKIDADEFTQLAPLYTLSPLTTASVATTTVGAAIPDNDAAGITRTFDVTATTPLEEMLVSLNVTHTFRGDLEAFLTSPSGTTSRLMIRSLEDSGQNINWTFASNAFWGENPKGTWSLKIIDTYAGDTGTWNSFGVTLRMGTVYRKYSLRGTVTSNGVPLSGVAITVTGVENRTATTGGDGTYLIENLREGAYTVSASVSGYSFSSASQNVTLSADTTVNFTATAVAWTARDIAQSSDGSTRILMTNEVALRIQKWTGSMQTGTSYTPAAGWTPVAIAADGVGRTFVLLRNGTTSYQVWIMDGSGTRTVALAVQTASGWTATDISAAGDGTARVLMVGPTGQVRVIRLNGSAATFGPIYTPSAGWSGVGIAAGADNKTRLLWRKGTANYQLWTLNAACALETAHTVQTASGFTPREISHSGDGTSRVFLVSPAGQIRVNRISGNAVTVGSLYTPASGWSGIGVSADPDTSGKTRLLWQHSGGALNLWTLGPTGVLQGSAALGTW